MWNVYSHNVRSDALPPDLTNWQGLGICGDWTSPDGFVCTRPVRHTGRHASGDGDHIIAVWECPDVDAAVMLAQRAQEVRP